MERKMKSMDGNLSLIHIWIILVQDTLPGFPAHTLPPR